MSKLLFLKLLEEKQDRDELGFVLPYTYRFHELAQRGTSPDQVKDAALSMMLWRMEYGVSRAWRRSLSPTQASQFRSWMDEIGRKLDEALPDRGE